MLSRITESELQIFETLCNPVSCVEVMFDDLGSLTEFTPDKNAKVRLYQYQMLSYESLFFENPNLSNKENFKIKKGLGDCINFGGRLTGKSLIGVIVDAVISSWHKTYRWGAVSSCDAVKIRGIMESIITVFDNHPIFKNLNAKSKSHPAYLVTFATGAKLESVNNNMAGKEPGKNWFQKHVDKSWEEEASFLNDSISSKKLMSQSEFGMVERLTGMANFKKQSPIGRKFFDLKNENIVINIPSYANETWDDEKDEAATKEFGGKQCFDVETEIFTQTGWKKYNEITKEDKVLSWDIQNNKQSYEKINNIFIYDYDGDLYEYKTMYSDFLITNTHRLPVKTLKKDYRIVDLQTILNNKPIKEEFILKVTNNCLFCGKKLDKSFLKKQKYFCSVGHKNSYCSRYTFYPVKEFRLNQNLDIRGDNTEYINIGKYTFSMEDWVRFLGWFISEGCVCEQEETRGPNIWTHWNIQISQSEGSEYLEEIQKVLKKLRFRDSYNGGCFRFTNKIIGQHLLQYCGKYARNKHIPQYVKNLDKKYLNLFLDAFNAGDGDGKRTEYYTSSLRLADDLQELILKCGHNGVIYLRPDRDSSYTVSERKQEIEPTVYVDRIKKVPYKGKIWCIETLPYNTMFIRRNSKVMWSANSPGYRTQILGQVVDDGDSVYDIERVRECYKRDKDGDPILIKSFEINRTNFYRFKEVLVLDRPSNADSVWICLDKGEGAAPTEIIVLFKVGDIYRYEYNITDFKLSPDEDDIVVEYIIEVLKANIVGIDTTSGGGKAMFSHLAKKYPENIVGVSFNEKIAIDFERNDQNEIIRGVDGTPKYKEEFIVDWSIQRLKHLFYNNKILAHYDMKLDTQFDSIFVMRSGQRTVYGSKMANHLHQAFQVFAIVHWNYEFKLKKPISAKKHGLGAY